MDPRRHADETLPLAAMTPPGTPGPPGALGVPMPASGAVEVKVGAPRQLGPYRILETLGEGGFGMVYLAEQTEPVRRRVALKVLKPGIDSRSVIARFEAERQALAMMDHPNVARVFDAGTLPDGRPYFVMEHVPGIALTDHCTRHRLGIEARLELMIQVAEAVQHAHQKGIIHRDLKPSNILVEFVDGRAIPKVIDFGVAKAIGETGPMQGGAHTEIGQLVGTPEYMSPEQAERTAQDIDTRSDIYSLGVLLYELLTGTLPFDSVELRRATYVEIQRIIRETDPPRPSTRLSTVVARSDDSTLRRTSVPDPRAASRRLKGDLDWIVMKAMEKDRTRRYDTAAAFAEDLRRHLRHEPVTAGPPSATYRLRKFARRNRGVVVSGAIISVALVAGAVASTWFAIGQSRARAAATSEAAKAVAVTGFLSDMLAAADPSKGDKKDLTVRETLDQASARMDTRFKDQPQVESFLRATLGKTYQTLGLLEPADKNLSLALTIDRAGAADSLRLAESLDNLARLRIEQGRYPDAKALSTEAVAMRERLGDTKSPGMAMSLQTLAWGISDSGAYADAEPVYRRALELVRRTVPPSKASQLASCCNGLALCLKQQRKFDEAEALYKEGIAAHASESGADGLPAARATANLANLLAAAGRSEEALEAYRTVNDIYAKRLDRTHPDVSGLLNNMGHLLMSLGRFSEAEPLFREAISGLAARYGPDHINVCMSRSNLAKALSEQGQFEEAAKVALEAVESSERSQTPGHWYTAVFRCAYGRALTGLGNLDEAQRQLTIAYPILEAKLGAAHERTRLAAGLLADVFEKQKKPEEAASWRAKSKPPEKAPAP